MTCERAQELFSDLIDAELDAGARRDVVEHVAGCDACRRELRALQRTVRFVRGNARVDAAAGPAGAAWEDVLRAITDASWERSPEATALRFLADGAERGQ